MIRFIYTQYKDDMIRPLIFQLKSWSLIKALVIEVNINIASMLEIFFTDETTWS